MHPAITAPIRWLTSLERDLIGWELPPLDIAFAEVPIVPDTVDAWCPRCGISVGAGEVNASGCAECRDRSGPLRGTIRVGEYGGGLAQRVLQVKHARWFDMARRLGTVLGNQVIRALRPDDLPEAVMPIPMPPVRRLVRGIDHAGEIAHGVAQVLRVPLWRPLRHIPGRTQVGRSQSERRRATHRLEARRGLFRGWTARGGGGGRCPSPYQRVLIVDDVRTTGATLEQAARVLQSIGVSECWSAVVAVAPSPRRQRRNGVE